MQYLRVLHICKPPTRAFHAFHDLISAESVIIDARTERRSPSRDMAPIIITADGNSSIFACGICFQQVYRWPLCAYVAAPSMGLAPSLSSQNEQVKSQATGPVKETRFVASLSGMR